MSTGTPATTSEARRSEATTSPATTKKDVLERLPKAWIPFRLAIASLAAEDLERPTPAGWTYKQMVAHVAAWHEVTVPRLRALRETGRKLDTPELNDVDAFNARVATEAKDTDVEDVLTRLDRSYEELGAAIASLEEGHFQAFDRWAVAITAGNSFGHYAEHMDELMAAVPKTREALLERFEAGWKRFRRTVDAADLERVTSAGWRGKQMLAHASYWMTTVPAELQLRMEGHRGPLADVDAENARAAQGAASLSSQRVVSRLDAAADLVRQTLRTIPADREVPFLAARLIAAETYDHFRKHTPELLEIAR